MEGSPAPAPRPRPFPCVGDVPGPRCGHTLTAIAGPDGDHSSAKLILFGEHACVLGWPAVPGGLCWVRRSSLISAARYSTATACAGGATALEGTQRTDGGPPASPGPPSGTGAALLPAPAAQ